MFGGGDLKVEGGGTPTPHEWTDGEDGPRSDGGGGGCPGSVSPGRGPSRNPPEPKSHHETREEGLGSRVRPPPPTSLTTNRVVVRGRLSGLRGGTPDRVETRTRSETTVTGLEWERPGGRRGR